MRRGDWHEASVFCAQRATVIGGGTHYPVWTPGQGEVTRRQTLKCAPGGVGSQFLARSAGGADDWKWKSSEPSVLTSSSERSPRENLLMGLGIWNPWSS